MLGHDLTPKFVFSSGRLRAEGLAFRFPVYWARSTTLALDYPVQQIDDCRARHLVEASPRCATMDGR